jgi:hypothetical protein
MKKHHQVYRFKINPDGAIVFIETGLISACDFP